MTECGLCSIYEGVHHVSKPGSARGHQLFAKLEYKTRLTIARNSVSRGGPWGACRAGRPPKKISFGSHAWSPTNNSLDSALDLAEYDFQITF